MSALNLSLYGYPRETSPFLSNFAERSTVYHSHYSASNFTTCATASMLTGMLPWKHRAFQYGGLINSEMTSHNPYSLFRDEYFRTAFCQNPWADHLVAQFYGDVDRFLPLTSFSLRGNTLLMDKIGKDRALSSIAFDEFLFNLENETMGSSLMGYLYKSAVENSAVKQQTDPRYPKGLPEIDGFAFYTNQGVYEGVLNQLRGLEETGLPYFSYFHLYSPHQPYKPDRKHFQLFQNDGIQFPVKPLHPFNSARGYSENDLLEKRIRYDQQVADVDSEFGSLIKKLDAEGVLDHSYVIVTADHGEMFERGFFGHGERMMYEPVIHIPLLIHTPGQTTRQDVRSRTSNVDLLPTLYAIDGKTAPAILDGKVFPEMGGVKDDNRPLFSIEAFENSAFLPIKKAVIAMRIGDYKLIAYPGYEKIVSEYELYDIASDPDELHNLAEVDTQTLSKMKEEFLAHLADANQQYKTKQFH